ncbi:hypothetical protein BD626DRAFT_503710 [Schizophyllum amplum]|uniref:Uncharacterized protein n=1 Tax=Schizophyllum amplum TaxID=97359 RepID=A0A550C7G8_9AGAR|nr:hypothetical protein BD626DRAFT_503710 [Auriculariopsis ampla]
MKLTLLASLSAAATVLAAPAEEFCNNGANCYGAVHGWSGAAEKEPYQTNLMNACLDDGAAINGTGNLWSNKACVAVGASSNKVWPETVQGLAGCANQGIACLDQQPNLDYNLYAGIVGDCAWAPEGCPITQQNFIDFVYSTLSDIGSDAWPSSVDKLISIGWQPLLDWTQTGDSVPYTNFNDFLHYS